MNNKYFFPSIIFLISIIVFIITLTPTVGFTDNGELAGVACTLGIAHPTGYPLFTFLGHIWSLIPFTWTKIYQLNLLSAIYVSFSAVVLYFTLLLFFDNLVLRRKNIVKSSKKKQSATISYEITKPQFKDTFTNKFIAFALTLTAMFSTLVWEEATQFEVYSLQFLLINLTIYFFLKSVLISENHKMNMVLASLFVGLSFANHLTTILILPAFLFLYFKRPQNDFDFSQRRIKNLIYLILIAAIGLTFYFYLPIRSFSEPAFNWGYVHRGFDKFFYHIQGKQYQEWMFSGLGVAIENFWRFISSLPNYLTYIGIILVIDGLYRLYKSYSEIFWFFIILLFSCIFYSVNYSIHDIDVYFYLAFYSLIFISGAGAIFFVEKFEKYKYLVLVLPLMNLTLNFSECDKSNNYLVYDYTRNVVDNLGRNAVIISSQWDYWVAAFWYLQKVENYRPDIVVVDKELLRRTWYPRQLKNWYPKFYKNSQEQFEIFNVDVEKFESGAGPETYPNIQENFVNLLESFVKNNIDERPIYITFDYANSGADASFLRNYRVIPDGFALKIEKKEPFKKVNFDKLNLTRFINYPKNVENHLEKGILETSSINILNLGSYAEFTGDKVIADSAYRLALKINPLNDIARKNLNELERRR